MGVRGLQSFLKINHGLSQKVHMNGTSIVIDANNLLCFLYCNLVQDREGRSYRSDIYGGDMVAYGEAVKEFFASLDKCDIIPILVFDGSVIGKKSTREAGAGQVVSKERTIYERSMSRFEMARNTTERCPDERISMPTLINNVFRNIVSDLGLQKIQTPYEADSHIARLANDLKCPVLTNDSDFLIYSLPEGFILIDSFNYKKLIVQKDRKCSIECTIYSQTRLMKHLPGLQAETMPLLGILLGNDYVETGTFDRVIDPICNCHYNGTLMTQSFAHRKIANILTWLRGRSLNEAIDQILLNINHTRGESIRQAIKILLRNYRIEETDNFETEVELIYPASRGNPEENIHPELLPPTYLRRILENGDSNVVTLDIIFGNTFYNYPTIDDFRQPSSSYVKYRPMSLAVTLLRSRSYLNLTSASRQAQADRDALIIWDRVKGEYTKLSVRPIEFLDSFGSLEHLNLYSTITLQGELKKALLVEIFRFNCEELNLLTDTISKIFKEEFVHESCICLLLVKYIGLETKMAPKPQFVDAIVLTLLYYAAIARQLNEDSISDSQYGSLLLKLRPLSMKKALETPAEQHPEQEALYRRILHFISQLQSAYTAFSLVNSILNHVFQTPRCEKFLNGTLIYRLTKMLRMNELTLNSICGDMPTFLDVAGSIKVLVHCAEG